MYFCFKMLKQNLEEHLKCCISCNFKKAGVFCIQSEPLNPQQTSFWRSLLFVWSPIYILWLSKANGVAQMKSKSGQAG